jgi:hypothetical protein
MLYNGCGLGVVNFVAPFEKSAYIHVHRDNSQRTMALEQLVSSTPYPIIHLARGRQSYVYIKQQHLQVMYTQGPWMPLA